MTAAIQAPASNPVLLASPEEMRTRIRRHTRPKGRQVDPDALQDVRGCIGDAPAEGHRRDLLIEYLHKLNDRFGVLRKPHLTALASEMRLPMADVHEVASFYHHFEIVEGDVAAPRLTVRVCSSLSCELAGSAELLQAVRTGLGPDVRVIAAPCIGRCEQASEVPHQRVPTLASSSLSSGSS